jgi:hypothetical protein
LTLRKGGKTVVPKMVIPGVGHVAYCRDPEGNIFGLFEDDQTERVSAAVTGCPSDYRR